MPHVTINYKGIWILKAKAKTIQILEENMREFFYNQSVVKLFKFFFFYVFLFPKSGQKL